MKGFNCVAAVVAVLFFLLIIVFPVSAYTVNEEGTYTLGEIVVSAKQPVVESVGEVREVTAEDIKKSGAKTLDQAIRLLPGLILKTGGDGTPRVDIRGMRSRHVVLLLDGIPFNSTYDGQFDPSLISVESIAKIKVSYGSHSVLYGTGGLGGVINIITKKGTNKTSAEATLQAGEKESYLGKASLSGGLKKIDYFVSGSKYQTDGYLLSDDFVETSQEDGDLRLNSDRETQNLFGNFGFSPNDQSEIGIVLSSYSGEYGIPPNTVDDNTDPFWKRPKYERLDDYDGLSGQLSGSYDINGPLSFRGWFYYNELNELKNGYDDDTYSTQDARRSYHQDDETKITGGDLQTAYDFESAGSITLAIGTKREDYDTRGWEIERVSGVDTPVNFMESHEVKTNSAALEYEIKPINNLGIVLGYGHYWYDKENGNDDEGSYMMGAHYDFSQATRLRGSFARKIRFPSIRQLYDPDAGNEDLKPEESMNYELGVEHQFNRSATTVSVAGFISDVENYIERDNNSSPFENNEKYLFQGVELSAENRFFKALMFRAGYTYMDSEDKSAGSLKDELQYRPKHKLTLEGYYNFKYGISLYADLQYLAEQYYYNDDASEKGKLPNYTVVNLKLDKGFFSNKLNLYVGMENVFDEYYEESYGLPREGRMFYGGITGRL